MTEGVHPFLVYSIDNYPIKAWYDSMIEGVCYFLVVLIDII